MKLSNATTAIALALLSTIPPSEAFAARPSFISSSQISHIKNYDTIFPSRVGAGGTSSGSLAMSSTETANEVVTVSTSPIEGMKPGTSGLRKSKSHPTYFLCCNLFQWYKLHSLPPLQK